MDNKNFAIGVLSVTAVMMLVGLIVISARPEPAYAAGMAVSSSDYVLVVGKLTGTEELLYVIDGPAQRMGVYGFDAARREIRLSDGVELGKYMEQAEAAAPKQPTNPPPKGRRGAPGKNP